MTRVTAAQNKARSKLDEKDVARRLGGVRHLADSGGPEDVAHDWLAIQVKGGRRLMTDTVRLGVDQARVAAAGKAKLPVCVVVDRSGPRLRRFVVVDLDDFAAWHNLGQPTLACWSCRHPAHEPDVCPQCEGVCIHGDSRK